MHTHDSPKGDEFRAAHRAIVSDFRVRRPAANRVRRTVFARMSCYSR